ncbi:hypothetical protein JCM8202v2_001340, partial [Rhodotorula sphaerocarpa]
MSGDRVGYQWPALAQQAFMAGTCRAGQSISEWCALSAGDRCCGALCPNPPITGPGAVIVFTTGTLMNMLVALLWKSEAPFNLLLQMLATDGAFAGLLFRLLLTDFRLTEFHAAFVPLAIMSCLPVAFAACTVEVECLHNLDYTAFMKLWARLNITREGQGGQEGHELQPIAGEAFKGRRTKEQQALLEKGIKEDTLYGGTIPRTYLPWIILSVFGVHLIGWAFLFIMSLSVGARNPSQENCDSDLPVAFWSRAVGIAAIICWFAMVLLWLLLLVSMKRWRTKSRGTPRQDVLQILMKFTHSTRLITAVAPVRQGWSKKREIVRWTLSFIVYFAWVSTYIAFYIFSLMKLVMLGDNPFDYGQVAYILSVLSGAITVLRCVANEPSYYRARDGTIKHVNIVTQIMASVSHNKREMVETDLGFHSSSGDEESAEGSHRHSDEEAGASAGEEGGRHRPGRRRPRRGRSPSPAEEPITDASHDEPPASLRPQHKADVEAGH